MRRTQQRGLSYNYPRTPGFIALHGRMTHSHYPCLGVPRNSLRGLDLASGTEQTCGVTPYPPATSDSGLQQHTISLELDSGCYGPSPRITQVYQSPKSSNRPSFSVAMDGRPIHYSGPLNPCSYTLQGAVGNTYSQTNQKEKSPSQYKGCPSTLCRYWSPNAPSCNTRIDCGSAPEHLREVHEVRDISRSTPMTCAWTGCGQSVLRNNLIRHLREVHLHHERYSGH
ncbi:hypothetical protein F5141DRAFT_826255 [Pisolithus sp. B1]|nr:hypothetical protein F5141DRAFT_826255 [Pisolithus sp. B1]